MRVTVVTQLNPDKISKGKLEIHYLALSGGSYIRSIVEVISPALITKDGVHSFAVLVPKDSPGHIEYRAGDLKLRLLNATDGYQAWLELDN